MAKPLTREQQIAQIQAAHDRKTSQAWEAFQAGRITEDQAIDQTGRAFEWSKAELLKVGLTLNTPTS